MKCFRLRCCVNNSFLVFHQGTKHSKTIKHSRFALVFHTVFSCLDPLMKHSNSLFTYNISLNARECVLLNFHQVFADLYAFLFGKKAKLAKKPKPWRISLLLEVIYGGWTLIRDMILSVFYKCKDIEFLTLVNLLDNYVPLVLSIYSIVFKCNKYELFCQSLLQYWVMFTVFKRHHYNKALLVMLSTFLHLQENTSSMFETLRQNLVAFDEYPVENFHSVLRRRTKETDTADEISNKAKEIDACKHNLQSFQSVFVPPRKFNFSRKRINKLKANAAEFITLKSTSFPGLSPFCHWEGGKRPWHRAVFYVF